jgi:hypothetical protein
VNLVEAALRRVAADLAKYDRRWALVGGFAVSARAEPRFTRDIDAAVAVADDADGEGLVRLMLAHRYRLLASVEQDETGRLADRDLRGSPAPAPRPRVVMPPAVPGSPAPAPLNEPTPACSDAPGRPRLAAAGAIK